MSGSPEVAPRPGRARRVAAGLMGALACAGLLAACGSGGSSSALVLYNGQHTQTTDALVAAFEKATGLSVTVRSNDEDVLADQIAQEQGASPADLYYSENSPALEFLDSHHLLAGVDRSTLEAVPSRFDATDGDWVGVSARVSVLVYNTSLLRPSELPRSILGLAARRFDGKLAIAPTETDFQPIVTALDRSVGRSATLSFLEAIKRNGAAHTYQDNEAITAAVNSGQAAIGVINQYYWYRLRAELGAGAMHSRLAFFAPGDPGYVLDVSGAAVLRSSHHQAEAQRFLAFLVSRAGQEILSRSDSFEYPLRPGIAPAAGQPPLAGLRPYPITLAELGDGSTAIALMRAAQLLP